MENLNKWIVGIFLGAMLYIFLAHRDKSYKGGASNYAPAPHDSFSIGLGINIVAAESCCSEPLRGLPPSENCVIPLAADYLGHDPGYAQPISPVNVSYFCCYYGGEQQRIAQQSTCAYSVGHKGTIPELFPVLGEVSCNPDVQACVPGTETV